MTENVLIFVGMVVAGGLTLLIEAYRNFNSSLSSTRFSEHPILRDMKVGDLCTRREKTAGFLFYSLLYLVTYVVILSSTEIYALIQKAEASGFEIGPIDTLTGTAPEAQSLFGTNYAKPIYVSAAIIAIFSIGALSPIENTMRTLAHRLSGVPRGVYQIIDRMQRIDFTEKGNGEPRPLTDMFDKNAKDSFEASFEKGFIPEIKAQLSAIDYLSPTLTGKQRVRHFPLTQLDAMMSMSNTLEVKIARLRRMLSATLPDNDDARQELHGYVKEVSNDSVALFAVHYLRNNRAIKNAAPGSVIQHVETAIAPRYQVEANSFVMGLLMTLVASFILSFALYFDWQPINHDRVWRNLTQDPSMAELCTEDKGTYPGTPGIFDDDLKPTPEFTESSEIKSKCASAWKKSADKLRVERISLSTKNAILQPLTIAFGFAIAAMAALFVRDVRLDDKSWRSWKLRQPAFLQLISTSFLPAAFAVLGVAGAELLMAWIASGFAMTQSDVAFLFQSKGLFFLMQAPIGFVVSLGVLTLSDHHDRLNFWRTVLLGLFFGLIAMALYLLVIMVSYPSAFQRDLLNGTFTPFIIRETLIYGSVALFFLTFYAIWLEITEAGGREQTSETAP